MIGFMENGINGKIILLYLVEVVEVEEYKKEDKRVEEKNSEIHLNCYTIFINLNARPKMKFSLTHIHILL